MISDEIKKKNFFQRQKKAVGCSTFLTKNAQEQPVILLRVSLSGLNFFFFSGLNLVFFSRVDRKITCDKSYFFVSLVFTSIYHSQIKCTLFSWLYSDIFIFFLHRKEKVCSMCFSQTIFVFRRWRIYKKKSLKLFKIFNTLVVIIIIIFFFRASCKCNKVKLALGAHTDFLSALFV